MWFTNARKRIWAPLRNKFPGVDNPAAIAAAAAALGVTLPPMGPVDIAAVAPRPPPSSAGHYGGLHTAMHIGTGPHIHVEGDASTLTAVKASLTSSDGSLQPHANGLHAGARLPLVVDQQLSGVQPVIAAPTIPAPAVGSLVPRYQPLDPMQFTPDWIRLAGRDPLNATAMLNEIEIALKGHIAFLREALANAEKNERSLADVRRDVAARAAPLAGGLNSDERRPGE